MSNWKPSTRPSGICPERMKFLFLIPIGLFAALIVLTIKVTRERLREARKLRPIYFVTHPDGSFSRADPQP